MKKKKQPFLFAGLSSSLTVNAQYDCSILEHHLRPALSKEWRHLRQSPPIIFHDTFIRIQLKNGWCVWSLWLENALPSPYSPGLCLHDFDFIPNTKETLWQSLPYRSKYSYVADSSIWRIYRTKAANGMLLASRTLAVDVRQRWLLLWRVIKVSPLYRFCILCTCMISFIKSSPM